MREAPEEDGWAHPTLPGAGWVQRVIAGPAEWRPSALKLQQRQNQGSDGGHEECRGQERRQLKNITLSREQGNKGEAGGPGVWISL